MIYDPFFAGGKTGQAIARWANRVLITAELCTVAYAAHLVFFTGGYPWWYKVLFMPAAYLAVNGINLAVRILCKFLFVIRYATTDPDEVYRSVLDRQIRKARRQSRNSQRIQARRAGIIRGEDARRERKVKSTSARTAKQEVIYDPNDRTIRTCERA